MNKLVEALKLADWSGVSIGNKALIQEAIEQLAPKPRREFLELAESCGAYLTGKPDGSEPITIVFPIKAWREFDAAIAAQSAPVVPLASSRVGRIYLAGPMTGIEHYNFPAFNAEAARLRAQGFHVENPAEHGIVEGADWADYLRYDIGRLATCERIHLLPGWSKSKGARLEVHIAQSLGMHVGYAEGAEDVPAQPAARQEQGDEVRGLREALTPFAAIEIDCATEIVPNGYADPQEWRSHVRDARAALAASAEGKA